MPVVGGDFPKWPERKRKYSMWAVDKSKREVSMWTMQKRSFWNHHVLAQEKNNWGKNIGGLFL
jgi:hypothetical protein